MGVCLKPEEKIKETFQSTMKVRVLSFRAGVLHLRQHTSWLATDFT